MDTWKDVVSLLGSIVGLLTALIPLYARFVDKRKQAAQAAMPLEAPPRIVRPRPAVAWATAVEVEEEPVLVALPAGRDPRQIERARALVKGPAIALLVAGFVGLIFNVFVAGFGFVDEFVTPLSTDGQQRARARAVAAIPAVEERVTDGQAAPREKDDPATAAMTIIMLLSFSVACIMAIWAGFNMIKLRSYWLSMAGSFAVMPGACFCCLAGLPVGIWSLAVLLKPEVSASFH
jgi:hypothetical protein